MKSITTSLLFYMIMLSAPNAGYGQAHIYLSNYTVSANDDVVGYVHTTTGDIKNISIAGAHAAAFKINKNMLVVSKREKLKPGTTYDVVLTLKTSEGQLSNTFRIVKDDFIRNKVIAHRGAWKNTGVPENSIAALNHAITLGCEGSEFDVHMSADSLPVINHDPTILNLSIARTKSATLLSAIKLPNGETLPTLEEYLNVGMKQNKTKLILEIKASELGKQSSLALTRKIVAMVERLHGEAWVDYISFDYDVCKEVLRLAPYAKVSYLKGDKTPAELAADKFYGLDYHFSVFQKKSEWIKDAQERKLTINVWTVNERAMLEELLKQHVDFITTNEPEMLLELVK